MGLIGTFAPYVPDYSRIGDSHSNGCGQKPPLRGDTLSWQLPFNGMQRHAKIGVMQVHLIKFGLGFFLKTGGPPPTQKEAHHPLLEGMGRLLGSKISAF